MGLAYLAPIGAQNLFVINTALTAPLGIALVTAGIVAFFDISLALACFWGIGLVIEHSLLLQKALLGGGGLILIYLAWQLLHAQVQTDTSAYSQPTLWQTATLATLLACLVTYKLRDLRFKGLALAASLPPVLFNAVIIGIEIAVLFPDPSSSAPLWLACITNGISVGIGELISCTVLGVLLVKIIETNAALRKVFVSE